MSWVDSEYLISYSRVNEEDEHDGEYFDGDNNWHRPSEDDW